MGACLSSTFDSQLDTCCWAFVISRRGELRHYPTPVFVSEVLQSEKQTSSFFLCNSDNLYCDKHIPALGLEDELDAGQIYFILPKKMLGRPLTSPDMAALAVKASVALDSNPNPNSNSEPNNKKMNKKKNKARISPLVLMESSRINVVVDEDDDRELYENNDDVHKRRQPGNLRVSRSGSIRKTTPKYSSSKKSRLRPLRSFTLGLSTIYENEGGCDI